MGAVNHCCIQGWTGVLGGTGNIGLDPMFVRLPDADRTELLAEEGTSLFEPMPGRPMREYVTIPNAWREELERVRSWVIRSLRWVGERPAKQPRARRKKKQ